MKNYFQSIIQREVNGCHCHSLLQHVCNSSSNHPEEAAKEAAEYAELTQPNRVKTFNDIHAFCHLQSQQPAQTVLGVHSGVMR